MMEQNSFRSQLAVMDASRKANSVPTKAAKVEAQIVTAEMIESACVKALNRKGLSVLEKHLIACYGSACLYVNKSGKLSVGKSLFVISRNYAQFSGQKWADFKEEFENSFASMVERGVFVGTPQRVYLKELETYAPAQGASVISTVSRLLDIVAG